MLSTTFNFLLENYSVYLPLFKFPREEHSMEIDYAFLEERGKFWTGVGILFFTGAAINNDMNKSFCVSKNPVTEILVAGAVVTFALTFFDYRRRKSERLDDAFSCVFGQQNRLDITVNEFNAEREECSHESMDYLCRHPEAMKRIQNFGQTKQVRGNQMQLVTHAAEREWRASTFVPVVTHAGERVVTHAGERELYASTFVLLINKHIEEKIKIIPHNIAYILGYLIEKENFDLLLQLMKNGLFDMDSINVIDAFTSLLEFKRSCFERKEEIDRRIYKAIAVGLLESPNSYDEWAKNGGSITMSYATMKAEIDIAVEKESACTPTKSARSRVPTSVN